MELNSFVVTVQEFLKFEKERLNGDRRQSLYFNTPNRYTIPLYQREYKWTDVRVRDLIQDIEGNDKLLGMVILNRRENSYDIVDGQQRITSIILVLAEIFNRYASGVDEKPNLEQQRVLNCIMPDGHLLLENESIGEWLTLEFNHLLLTIKPEVDVYCQKEVFEERWRQIQELLQEKNAKNLFLNKLLNCKILVLICESPSEVYSAEQIFMDINDKNQRLETEEIFKGYCFNVCHSDYHDMVKEKWVKLKKNYFQLRDWVGNDFNMFLYNYFLCQEDYTTIGNDLKNEGTHILQGQTTDQVLKFLDDMVAYSESLCKLHENLEKESYRFEDICPDSMKYDADVSAYKDMMRYIMGRKDQYYKFPMMFLIHNLLHDEELRTQLDFSMFQRLVSNYYLYAVAFAGRPGKRDKKWIAQNILSLLEKRAPMKEITEAVKQLRKENMQEIQISTQFSLAKFSAVYSAMDQFDQQTNRISFLYNKRTKYSDEHFIIHNNDRNKVQWLMKDGKELPLFLKESVDSAVLSDWKKSFANRMVLYKPLNEKLKSYDVIEKIRIIEAFYEEKSQKLPTHVQCFINHVKNQKGYSQLEQLKDDEGATEKEIQKAYLYFMKQYFSEGSKKELREQLQMMLQNC